MQKHRQIKTETINSTTTEINTLMRTETQTINKGKPDITNI